MRFIINSKTESNNVGWERDREVQSVERDLDLILPGGEGVYDPEAAKVMRQFAATRWKGLERWLRDELKRLGFNLPDEITCVLTKWGCGGAFNPDANSVTVRLNRGSDFDRFDWVLVHEILHLLTYSEEQTYQEREDKVDDLIENIRFVEKVG